ncbi:MAG: hypothetical protein HDT23_08900 [Ruminococcus sp.]|nr:hypothetical protein [Ruminococcus sp.]
MIRVESYDWGFQGYSDGYDGWHSKKANSAGGVSVKYKVKNYGSKGVKKYTVSFKAYNGANEIVPCTIRGDSIVGISSADFVCSNGIQDGFSSDVWYNYSIRYVEIESIRVVYDDDTTESCDGNYVLTPEEQQLKDRHDKKTASIGCITLIAIIVFIYWWIFNL